MEDTPHDYSSEFIAADATSLATLPMRGQDAPTVNSEIRRLRHAPLPMHRTAPHFCSTTRRMHDQACSSQFTFTAQGSTARSSGSPDAPVQLPVRTDETGEAKLVIARAHVQTGPSRHRIVQNLHVECRIRAGSHSALPLESQVLNHALLVAATKKTREHARASAPIL